MLHGARRYSTDSVFFLNTLFRISELVCYAFPPTCVYGLALRPKCNLPKMSPGLGLSPALSDANSVMVEEETLGGVNTWEVRGSTGNRRKVTGRDQREGPDVGKVLQKLMGESLHTPERGWFTYIQGRGWSTVPGTGETCGCIRLAAPLRHGRRAWITLLRHSGGIQHSHTAAVPRKKSQ